MGRRALAPLFPNLKTLKPLLFLGVGGVVITLALAFCLLEVSAKPALRHVLGAQGSSSSGSSMAFPRLIGPNRTVVPTSHRDAPLFDLVTLVQKPPAYQMKRNMYIEGAETHIAYAELHGYDYHVSTKVCNEHVHIMYKEKACELRVGRNKPLKDLDIHARALTMCWRQPERSYCLHSGIFIASLLASFEFAEATTLGRLVKEEEDGQPTLGLQTKSTIDLHAGLRIKKPHLEYQWMLLRYLHK